MVFVLTCLIAQLANEEIRKVISFFFSEWEQMLSLAEIAIRWAVINPVLCESFSRAEDLKAIARDTRRLFAETAETGDEERISNGTFCRQFKQQWRLAWSLRVSRCLGPVSPVLSLPRFLWR